MVNISNVCNYLSNTPVSYSQLMRKHIFLRRLQNEVPKVVNDIIPCTCLSRFYVEYQSIGAFCKSDIKSVVFDKLDVEIDEVLRKSMVAFLIWTEIKI